MIVTNSKEIYNQSRLLRDHGMSKEKKYWHTVLGYNYRMTDIQASLGISQLKKLNKFVRIRNKIAKIYNKELKNLPLQLPYVKKNNYSSFHLYVVQVMPNKKMLINRKGS